jgi:hypothetical protein
MAQIELSLIVSRESYGKETSRRMVVGNIAEWNKDSEPGKPATDDVLIAMSTPLSSLLLGGVLAMAEAMRKQVPTVPVSPPPDPEDDGYTAPTPESEVKKREYQVATRLTVDDWPKPYRDTINATLAEAKLGVSVMSVRDLLEEELVAALDGICNAVMPMLREFFIANSLLLPVPMPIIGEEAAQLAAIRQETENAWSARDRIMEAIAMRDDAITAMDHAKTMLAEAQRKTAEVAELSAEAQTA